MEKSMKKRGRPTIEPWMDTLITSRVLTERDKPAEERTPRNILAYEIQNGIKQTKAANERLPEISTLEKRISSYSKKASSEDEAWTIGTLGDYPISPEALPVVLATCKYAREAGNLFTIRQAKWTARLSGVLKDEPPWYLWYWTARYAGAELISRLINRPFDTTTLDTQLTDPESKQRAADQLKHQVTVWEHLLEGEQSGKKYPPAIWKEETTQEKQSTNQSKAKRQGKDKEGKK